MLILRRKRDERISIGADVEVMVIDIGPNAVKLGIRAPAETPIRRHESPTTPPDTGTATGQRRLRRVMID